MIKKNTVCIVLYRTELVRYIKELAYIVSKAGGYAPAESQGAAHKIADILDKEDGGTDGNDYIGTRMMNYAVAQLKSLVRKHICEPDAGRASHNAFGRPQEYHIHLSMETETPRVMAETLQEMMNRYVALSALAEWCKLWQSDVASTYLAEAEQVKTEITGVINPPTKHERGGWPVW